MAAMAPIGLAARSAKPAPPLSNDTSGLLRTVQGHIEDIRALIYCGIREIVQMFISRAELLDNNETTKEHLSNKQAETEKIDSDKRNTDPRNGGLFQGCFKFPTPFNQPIDDIMDGVTRCPQCTWELVDGSCLHCGFELEGYDSYDLSDEDESITMTDIADDIEDGFSALDGDYFADLEYHMHHHHHHVLHHEGSDEEGSHDSEMSDFIDDGPIEEDAETDRSTAIDGNTIMSDSDGEGFTGTVATSLQGPQRIHIYDDDDDDDGNNDNEEETEQGEDEDGDDDDDDEDDEPIRAPTRAVHQRCQTSATSVNRCSGFQSRSTTTSTRTSVDYSDDDDGDDDDNEDDEEGLSPPNISNNTHASGSNIHSPIPLEDDSDVPIAPGRSSRRAPHPGRIRSS
ncbi:hypothetical protein ACJ72_01182 [Emergomyces africanus]|uniref:Uncharacterized protein n=1 Tax=Emergomyces africanus TaxID=1955775 RepID=A0A1B7P637_9EURO|nr:hypothetical protein ACJ72_01182 [Emergomyces africanus]